MKRLVKVELAFGLMNKGDVYEADPEEEHTSKLLEVGYLSLVETPEQFFVAQKESELAEGTAKVDAPASRSKRGKVSDQSSSE